MFQGSSFSKRLIVLTALILLPGSAWAQDPSFGDPLGQIYLSAVPDARVGMLDTPNFTTFDFYIVTQMDHSNIGRPDLNGVNAVAAWEARVILPPELFVVSATTIPADNINLGTFPDWIVGVLGASRVSTTEPLLVAHLQGLFTQNPVPQDLVVDFGSPTPSTFDNLGPGWVDSVYSGDCFSPTTGAPIKCKRFFANVYGMRINCVADCSVKVESKSWGSVKANFRN